MGLCDPWADSLILQPIKLSKYVKKNKDEFLLQKLYITH